MTARAVRRQFGRYQIQEQIGAGGMGEVFRARDLDLQRDVAIKFISDDLAGDPNRLARFAQEARTASSLNHPNILTIHEIGQDAGRPFIVMELVEGQTLRGLVQQGPLPARRALDIAAQIASGLAKAHAAGIVHRDLKPENVMVTPDGFAKILDFGLAKLRPDEQAVEKSATTEAETTTGAPLESIVGAVIGTAAYMAPEQALGTAVDHRADQFSFGALLYEMATGRRAFRRDSVVQTLSAVIESEPEPIAALNPAFPESAAEIVYRCLSKDPQDRYASTQDLAYDLRTLRDRASDSRASSSGVLAPPPPGPIARRRGTLIGATLALLAVLLLIPGLPRTVTRWVTGPSAVQLAVLLDDSGLPEPDRARLAPLVDYATIRLAELDALRPWLAVVPASELRDAQVRSPGEASRVGATVAAHLSAQRVDGDLVISASLNDTRRGRVIRGDQQRFAAGVVSEDAVVEMIARLLRIELEPREQTVWTAGSSGVAEARTLFARGISQVQPYQLGLSELEQQDREQKLLEAIDLFNRAIELDPRYADAHARLGEAYLLLYRLSRRAEHLALAEQNAVRAQGLDDTRPSTWVTLGMIRGEKKEFAEAEAAFEQALLRGPRSDTAHRERGRVQLEAGDMAGAEASFRRAIELNPERWVNHNQLGAFLRRANRLEDAEAAFREAIRRAPENARAWANLGAVQFALGHQAEAEQSLQRSVSFYDHGQALSNLGTLRYYDGQYAEAAQLFERAVRVAPRDYRIWRNLASSYYWTPGERARAAAPLESAAALLEELRATAPANANVLAMLADVRAKQGQADAARQRAAEAVALDPASGDVARLAASVMEALGDRDAALRHIRVALAAGASDRELRQDPAFEQLVEDPRYPAIAKAAAAAR